MWFRYIIHPAKKTKNSGLSLGWIFWEFKWLLPPVKLGRSWETLGRSDTYRYTHIYIYTMRLHYTAVLYNADSIISKWLMVAINVWYFYHRQQLYFVLWTLVVLLEVQGLSAKGFYLLPYTVALKILWLSNLEVEIIVILSCFTYVMNYRKV